MGATFSVAADDFNSNAATLSASYSPARIAELNELSGELIVSDPERAKAIAEDALAVAKSIRDDRGQVEAMYNLGQIAHSRNELPAAAATLRDAQMLARRMDDQRLLAQIGNSLGRIYAEQGLDIEALDLQQKTLTTYETLEDAAGKVSALIAIAKVYEQRGDFTAAMDYLERARAEMLASPTVNSIGAADRVAIWTGLARLQLQSGQAGLAMQSIDQALEIPDQDISQTMAVKAQTLSSLGQLPQAFATYEQAIEKAASTGNKSNLATVLRQTGQLYWQVAQKSRYKAEETPTGEYLESAFRYTHRAINVAQALDSPHLLAPIYHQMTEIQEARGDLRRALASHKSFVIHREKIHQEQSKARHAALTGFYQIDEREELGALRSQAVKSTQLIARERGFRWILVITVALALLLAAALGFGYWERVRAGDFLRQARDTLRSALNDTEHALRRAEESERVKTEVLGMVAHDLRNPLSSILGFADLIRAERESLEDAKRHAGVIMVAAQRTLRLVTDLLESAALDSRGVELRPVLVNLSHLLTEAVERARARANLKSQQFELFSTKDALVRADPERLHQVFDNLLSNAIKFSPHHSRIEIRLVVGDLDVLVHITDFGPGFRAEDRSRLFQRFQRLTARPTAGESSTGLGLAIVKDLVELHGGQVSAESEGIGHGATFTVSLPRLFIELPTSETFTPS